MKSTATPTPTQGSRGAAGKETPDEKGRGKYRPEAAKAGDPAAPEMAGEEAALRNRKENKSVVLKSLQRESHINETERQPTDRGYRVRLYW